FSSFLFCSLFPSLSSSPLSLSLSSLSLTHTHAHTHTHTHSHTHNTYIERWRHIYIHLITHCQASISASISITFPPAFFFLLCLFWTPAALWERDSVLLKLY